MGEQITDRQREYREVYLRSEHWQAIRLGALERADHRCQICNSSKPPLDVHHRTYERVGEEWGSDLTVLCRRCHELFHGAKKPKRARSKRPRRIEKEALVLAELPGTTAQIAERTGLTPNSVGSTLAQLRREKKVCRHPASRAKAPWRLTDNT